jgi:pyruvate formate lyase activating enzyme
MEDRALLIDIQRLSTEDGPGVRTTVFFKGCNLRCAWCHNPESLSSARQVEWYDNRCIGCRICEGVCSQKGLSLGEDGMTIARELCLACGRCVKECPSGAMSMKGEEWALEDLVREVLKDRSFFGAQGGVTVSGGEVLLQSGFAAAFLKRLREEGVHTALDTAGCVGWEVFEKVLRCADLVLLDMKLRDPERHEKFTGRDNALILENAKRLRKYILDRGAPELWVRTPIIPGATDTDENIRGIGAFIEENLADVVKVWELCSFNNLCRDKYTRLGIDWTFGAARLMTRERMEALRRIAGSELRDPSIAIWSGGTAIEDE